MRVQVLNRKVHYWASAVIALPLLLVVGSGLLLQLKKQLPWVQPAEQRGSGKVPRIGPERMLEACRGVPEAEVREWADIARVDIRPSRGLVKVTAANGWELQLDAGTGEVLQSAYRRSDLIESLHDGSYFGDGVKLGVFLPAGLGLLLLWGTGVYLFWLPIGVKWRRKRTKG
jgi:uncharacterized iron-regulated membrane protein